MLIVDDNVEVPELEPIDDGNSDFEKVELRGSTNGKMHPHCTEHGAMIKVASWEDNEGMWRCIRSENLEDCRAGCIERRPEDNREDIVECSECGMRQYRENWDGECLDCGADVSQKGENAEKGGSE